MTYLSEYLTARKKLDPINSLRYVIIEQERIHPDLLNGFNSNDRTVLDSVVKACSILSYLVITSLIVKKIGVSEGILDNLLYQADTVHDYISFFLDVETVDQFVKDVVDSQPI